MAKRKPEPQKLLHYRLDKDEIYNRRESRVDPAFVPLLFFAAKNPSVSACSHKSVSLKDAVLADWVYAFRDLYMPQRAK